MKEANYRKSVSKWNNVIETLKKTPDGVCAELYLIDPCGFCDEFSPDGPTCVDCPLHLEFCSNAPNYDKVFWQICKALNNDENTKALELSERMLEKIKTYHPQTNAQKESNHKEETHRGDSK